MLPVNLKARLADGKKGATYTPQIAEAPALREFLQPFQLAGQSKLNVPVGSADGVLDGDRAHVRLQPTNLGHLIARAMMDRTGADLALINAGGVRDSLPVGAISYRDVMKVQPFSNTVGVVTLTGTELLAWLQAAAKMTPGSGGYPQTANVQLRIEAGVLQEARVAGQPIEAQRRYRLAINNFTAIGGDGYPKLHGHPGYIDTGFNDADVLRAYLAAHSPIKIADYAPGTAAERR